MDQEMSIVNDILLRRRAALETVLPIPDEFNIALMGGTFRFIGELNDWYYTGVPGWWANYYTRKDGYRYSEGLFPSGRIQDSTGHITGVIIHTVGDSFIAFRYLPTNTARIRMKIKNECFYQNEANPPYVFLCCMNETWGYTCVKRIVTRELNGWVDITLDSAYLAQVQATLPGYPYFSIVANVGTKGGWIEITNLYAMADGEWWKP